MLFLMLILPIMTILCGTGVILLRVFLRRLPAGKGVLNALLLSLVWNVVIGLCLYGIMMYLIGGDFYVSAYGDKTTWMVKGIGIWTSWSMVLWVPAMLVFAVFAAKGKK